MTITVKSYFSEGNKHGVVIKTPEKTYRAYTEIDGEVPIFFHELFTIIHLLTPGGPTWKMLQEPESKHYYFIHRREWSRIVFETPLHNAGYKLLFDLIKILDFNIKIEDTAGIWQTSKGKYNLKDSFQVAYSGGKESALTAYMLHEITGDRIYGTSSLYNGKDKTFPKWMKGKEVKVRPWQTTTVGIAAIAHAIQNRCRNVCIGFEYAGNLLTPNQYSVHGRAYHEALERYLNEVTEGMTFTSPVSFGIGNSILKILKERYPEAIKHLDCVPPDDPRYHLLLSYLDIPFPEYIKPFTEKLKTFQDCPTYNRLMHWIEARHLIVKMKGNPLLGDNPLQYTGESYPWIEKALWGCSKPRILTKEIKKIVKEHVKLDYEDRLTEAEGLWEKLKGEK